eukprot:523174_1
MLRSLSLVSKKRFSSFMDYSQVYHKYDKTRQAIATNLIYKNLEQMFTIKYNPVNNKYKQCVELNQFLKNVSVLDLGCGTGHYALKIFNFGVGNIYGMDSSDAMLEKSINKFANKSTNVLNAQSVELCKNEIQNLSLVFKEESFDAICINQVMHHLVEHGDENKKEMVWKIVLDSCNTILNKSGRLLITTAFPDQLQYGMFHTSLIQRVTDQFKTKHGDMDFWNTFLPKCGFCDVEFTLLVDGAVDDQDDSYFERIFEDNLAGYHSIFSLVTTEELQQARQKMRKILDDPIEKK